MTRITDMTLDECLWARDKEEHKLDAMIKVGSPFLIKAILEQEKKLESIDFWIERKRITESAE